MGASYPDLGRCIHRYPPGDRRCRNPVTNPLAFTCFVHQHTAPGEAPPGSHNPVVQPALRRRSAAGCAFFEWLCRTSLDCATNINRAIHQAIILSAEGSLSTRELDALLRSLRALLKCYPQVRNEINAPMLVTHCKAGEAFLADFRERVLPAVAAEDARNTGLQPVAFASPASPPPQPVTVESTTTQPASFVSADLPAGSPPATRNTGLQPVVFASSAPPPPQPVAVASTTPRPAAFPAPTSSPPLTSPPPPTRSVPPQPAAFAQHASPSSAPTSVPVVPPPSPAQPQPPVAPRHTGLQPVAVASTTPQPPAPAPDQRRVVGPRRAPTHLPSPPRDAALGRQLAQIILDSAQMKLPDSS